MGRVYTYISPKDEYFSPAHNMQKFASHALFLSLIFPLLRLLLFSFRDSYPPPPNISRFRFRWGWGGYSKLERYTLLGVLWTNLWDVSSWGASRQLRDWQHWVPTKCFLYDRYVVCENPLVRDHNKFCANVTSSVTCSRKQQLSAGSIKKILLKKKQ